MAVLVIVTLKTLPNRTLTFLTKVNIPNPHPAWGSLDLAQPGVTLLQHIITCNLNNNLKRYQNLVKNILGPLELTCVLS